VHFTPRALSGSCLTGLRSALCILCLIAAALPARAQFQQPFVFAAADPAGIAVYTRNDTTGVLTPVSGSPFPSREPVSFIALDFSGRFLFTASNSTSKISMFTIDPGTGALQEVPNSPFASSSTNNPVFLSVESTGQFLYVIDGPSVIASTLETFQIDATNLGLVPSATGAAALPGQALFCGAGTHPSGKTFYAFVTSPAQSSPPIPSQTYLVTVDGSSGTFNAQFLPNAGHALCLAVDPQGHFLAADDSATLYSYTLSSDGTLGTFNDQLAVTAGGSFFLTFDTFARFLYVTEFALPSGQTSLVHVFSTTPNSAALQETANSPLPSNFASTEYWIVDPTAPLLFADQVYQVDPQTGVPASILSTDPLIAPAPALPAPAVVFSIPPGSQPILGPLVLLSPPSVSFGNQPTGQISNAMTISITSNGGQALNLNSLSITGPNSTDFSETDNCHVPATLAAGQSCTAMVYFTPSATGLRSAALTITDNAPMPTASVPVTGTGVTPAPAVNIPATLNFATVTEGSSTTQNISIANSGTSPLHISAIALAGANAADFSSLPTAACNSPIAPGNSCSVAITFVPLAVGERSTTLNVTDDAANSPQAVQISGNATAAFTAGAIPGGSTSATVSAGQAAQFQLQFTPGTGFTGTISLTCSGAPVGAQCHVPATVAVTSGTAAQFTVTVSTSGSAALLPAPRVRITPVALVVALLLLVPILIFLVKPPFVAAPTWSQCGVLSLTLLCLIFLVAGCGGGGVSSPPPVITPSGTSTITVTPAAMSSSGQPLQLSPIQLTLTVN
jgi:6-phosphogluconolactonase (cycloisomerase 2 family)